MTKHANINHVELGRKLEAAREALTRFRDFDDGGPIIVKNRVMIDTRKDLGIATIIEYNGPDKPTASPIGYVVVSKRASSLFSGVHLLVDTIPVDNNWANVHQKNIATYMRLLGVIYEQETPVEERAQELLAVRRQTLMYKTIFPDVDIDITPSESERLLVVDARLQQQSGPHIEALAEFIAKSDKKAKS